MRYMRENISNTIANYNTCAKKNLVKNRDKVTVQEKHRICDNACNIRTHIIFKGKINHNYR